MTAAPILQFSQSLLEQCRVSKLAVESAWRIHCADVERYKLSGAWKSEYPYWKDFCKDEKNRPFVYAESTYRNLKMDIVLAEIVETVAGVEFSKTDARKLRENFAQIPDADKYLIPSIWQVCHSYAEKEGKASELLVPRKDAIAEAYEIIKDERDSNTLNVNGLTVDVKELAHNKRIKERLLQGILSRSRRETLLIEQTRHIAMLTRFLGKLGYSVGQDTKKLFIGYED